MKKSSSLFILSILFLYSCDYFPKEDKHPEVPFFEDIIKDKTIFEPIALIDKNNSDSHYLFFLNNGKYLSIKRSLEEVNRGRNDTNSKIDVERQVFLNVEIRDLENKLQFKEIIQSEKLKHIIIDKNANLYANGYYYLSPDYSRKQKLDVINISDSLSARTMKNLSPNEDSVTQVHLSILEKKFDFRKKDNDNYLIKNDRIIIFKNNEFVVDAERKQSPFDEFDDAILVEYRNDNRIFPSSYSYYYYNFGKIKFKYFDGKSGTMNPGKIEYDGQTYLFHPKFGIYKIKNS